MYTRRPPICIPGNQEPAAAPPGRHVPAFRLTARIPKDAVPFGFCSGGFTSTSSLRSGQRGPTEVGRRRYPRADHVPQGAVAFLSARPERSLPTVSLRKPFGFGVGVNGSRLTARLLPSSVVLPRRPPIPYAGHDSLENRDGRRTIRTAPRAVKHFLEKKFRPVFPALLAPLSAFGNFIHSRFPQVEISWRICGRNFFRASRAPTATQSGARDFAAPSVYNLWEHRH